MGQWIKWLNFGGYPDHRLDTWIVFRVCHYWEIRKVVNEYKSAAHADSQHGGTGKTCLDGGLHCPSAFSCWRCCRYYFKVIMLMLNGCLSVCLSVCLCIVADARYPHTVGLYQCHIISHRYLQHQSCISGVRVVYCLQITFCKRVAHCTRL